jgi:hypothetical protein
MKFYGSYSKDNEPHPAALFSQTFSPSDSREPEDFSNRFSGTVKITHLESNYLNILLAALEAKPYALTSKTWSSVVTSYVSRDNTDFDVTKALRVLGNLSFIEGDVQAEKRADEYFGQKKVKTRKIIIRNKS